MEVGHGLSESLRLFQHDNRTMFPMVDRIAELAHRRLPWNVHQIIFRLRGISSRLPDGRASKAHTLFSFDAFDTLITRPVFNPADMFLLVGHALRREALITLSPTAWHDLRCSVEAEMRSKGGDREITLDEIYDQIASRIAHASFDPIRAAEIEVAIEKALIRPIRSMVDALSSLAGTGPTAVLSDTYFSEADLTEMLHSCGISCDHTEVVASSRTGHTKRSGALFAALRQHQADHNLTHVGDNMFADVWRATRAGATAIPFVGGLPTRYEKILASSEITPQILRSAIAGSSRSARLRTAAATPHEVEIAKISSNVSGVMLVAFVAWVLSRAKALQLKRLYFLARDGDILIEIARRMIAGQNLALELRYLYVSRRSLHLPAVGPVCDDEDFKSMAFEPGQTLADLLLKLDLPLDQNILSKLKAAGFTPPADNATLSKDQLAVLKAALRHEELAPLIATRAAERRLLLIEYLRQEKMLDPGQFGIVDIGWKGRLQRSLCKVLLTEDNSVRARLNGFYYGLYDQPPDSGRFESYIDHPAAASIRPYVRGSLFEVFCAAKHGTTRSYARELDGSVAPVLASPNNEEADLWGLSVQREAILLFTEDLLAVTANAGIDLLDHVAPLTEAACAVSGALVGRPGPAEAHALGSFPHAVDQLHAAFAELAPPVPLKISELFRRLWYRRHAGSMISFWPEGSVARTFPSVVTNVVLSLYSSFRYR
jgi:FMN phosphatase YigB (HAD superfamily)